MSLDWLNERPPPGYVAGIGRGAQGFTTRSDIGPARYDDDPTFGAPAPATGGGDAGAASSSGGALHDDDAGGGGPRGAKRPMAMETSDAHEDLSESRYDKFSGYGDRLFANTEYTVEDREADAEYAKVDEYMSQRRKARKEAKEREMVEKYRDQNVKIAQQFAQLKEELRGVSSDEWMAIRDFDENRTRKFRATKDERYMPVSDRLLISQANEGKLDTAISAAPVSGLATPALDSGSLTSLSEARSTVIGSRLDRLSSDNPGTKTSVDPQGYLTSLGSQSVLSEVEIGDYKKAELLFKSLTETNPRHAPGWLAAARVQEKVGRLAQARKIIRKGCDACPDSEDLWLENARLQTPDNAKVVLAEAVRQLPSSVSIWSAAARLESDVGMKRRVLRRALKFNPTSVRLWKEAVQLEDPPTARLLLNQAVGFVPDSTDLWLALARLETYENAQKVLNMARQNIPTDPEIWITAAMLEESHSGQMRNVDVILRNAVRSLRANGVVITRDQWLENAQRAEDAKMPLTCQAIVRHTIGEGLEDEDRKRVWMDDAERLLKDGGRHVETARAIYTHALSVFPHKKSVWLRAAHLERTHGTAESVRALLADAVKQCPQAEVLWLLAAKSLWQSGDANGARAVLLEAFKTIPNNEEIWIAAVKIETEEGELARARGLLERARNKCNTPRVWMKSALLERRLGNGDAERELLRVAAKQFPTYFKLWLMLGQSLRRQGRLDEARTALVAGIKAVTDCVPLWIELARVEEANGEVVKARSVLDKARVRVPKNALLWLEAVRLEERHGFGAQARKLLSEALSECPTSGVLWYEAIAMEPRAGQKNKVKEANRRCPSDAYVKLATARLFWAERKVDRARAWLRAATQLDPTLGDAWAHLLQFEREYGTPETQAAVASDCTTANPRYGELWIGVSKDPGTSYASIQHLLSAVAAKVSV